MQRRIAAIAGALGLAAPAAAAAPGSAFQITPYVWATGLGGTVRPLPGAPTFKVSQSFSALLENLDGAVFVTGFARSGRFVAVADFSHVVASRKGLVPTPIPGVPVVPAEGRLRQTALTALGGVRAVDLPSISIDLLTGVRAFSIRTSVESAALGLARSPMVYKASPVLAGRFNGRLGDGWSLIVYGDFGGLGIGTDFTAQAAATINARIAPRLWLSGGYRYLMVDEQTDRTRSDLHLGGPMLGATLTF